MQELFKDLELSDEQKSKLLENFEVVKTSIVEVAQNDSKLINKLKKGAFAELQRKLSNALGLEKEEVENLNADELVNLAKQKVSELGKQTESEKDETIKSLKQKIQEYDTKTIPELQNKTAQEIKNFKLDNKLQGILSEIEGVGSLQARQTILKARINNDYKVDLDDNGEIIFETKDGLKPVFDNKTVTDPKELARHILDSEGLLIKNNNGKEPKNGSSNFSGSTDIPDAYKKRLQEMQNE